MPEFLLSVDRSITIWLNHAGSPWLDQLMILWSARWIWIPLYLFLISWLWFRLSASQLIRVVMMLAVLILLADQTASAVFKPAFERLRPCHDSEMLPFLRLPDGCGGQFGFASSHAANTMAITVFFMLLPFTWRAKSRLVLCLVVWSLITGWSRVYLGVHYAGDILGGYAIGTFWAAFLHLMVRKVGLFNEKRRK